MAQSNVSITSNPNKANADDANLVALFQGTDTASVSDALDKLGLHGQAAAIMPLGDYIVNKGTTVVGPAFTVRYVPATPGAPKGVGDYVDEAAPGDIIVIDNSGRKDCTVWGDIMTQYAQIRGIAATVIDGVCRDVAKAVGDGYPMFTAGKWMRTGKDRVELAATNGTVALGGVHVESRDLVVADGNGVVVVPRARAAEVAAVAREVEEKEETIRKLIAGDANGEGRKTLGEARECMGYHGLQRK